MAADREWRVSIMTTKQLTRGPVTGAAIQHSLASAAGVLDRAAPTRAPGAGAGDGCVAPPRGRAPCSMLGIRRE